MHCDALDADVVHGLHFPEEPPTARDEERPGACWASPGPAFEAIWAARARASPLGACRAAPRQAH
eukprot:693934-Alexandrium_andersonii.AAC.1